MQRRDRGLTLVEILTVVAILLVLGGIVFMATRPARMAGLVKSSQGQMRQLWVGMSLYAADNNGGEYPELYGLTYMGNVFLDLKPYGIGMDLYCCPGAPKELCKKVNNTYYFGPMLINGDLESSRKLFMSGAQYPDPVTRPAWVSPNFDMFYIYPTERDIPLSQARPYYAWVAVTGSAHARRVAPPRSLSHRYILGLD